ncbi:hypothetical protein PCANC_07019 [Puccinia coronata f. sp. avenae]|uniref:Uncharacterized protein n=2 Tax=Puccinia coronata f. sp. avenae TaxID=200324 RepID=A0A2N5VZU8_9BASI|nr:hypothetical protein PCANC_07019 [Puccinia coronata f. sp. avenae]
MSTKGRPTGPKFLGCLSSSQAHTLYSVLLLAVSLLTLANLPSSASLLFEHESGEEEEEDLVNSRTVLELSIVLARILAQSALVSSVMSLAGTVLGQARLQVLLKMQALVNLFLSASGLVVLGTLYLSPSLLMSAAHELCTFAMRSDSLASLSRTPDDSYSLPSFAGHSLGGYLWPTHHLMGQTCDERASSIVPPTLILLSLCNLLHLHLLYVLFSPLSSPSINAPSSPLLPIHHDPLSSHHAARKLLTPPVLVLNQEKPHAPRTTLTHPVLVLNKDHRHHPSPATGNIATHLMLVADQENLITL